MSDGQGFLVAAYVLTALTLLVYAIRLGLRRSRLERRLAVLRDRTEETRAPAGRPAGRGERQLDAELVWGGHV